MKVLRLETERIQVDLPNNRCFGSNKVDLLTGPNGSGKTEVLTFLAATFSRAKQVSKRCAVSWEKEGRIFTNNSAVLLDEGPERVIAQTFSPFTRFAQPPESTNSLTSIYSEGVADALRYVCIGLHKSTRLVGAGLSKRTLEQALYRLSETPESARAIFEVMRNLGFEDSFDLTYEARPTLKRLLESSKDQFTIELFLSELENRGGTYTAPRTGLSAELRRSNRGQIAELLNEALEIIGPQFRDARRILQHFGSYGRRQSNDYATLQSLALLRRLDLLTLKSCELTTHNGTSFDVADASSGQQQMLCSIIGLATALRNESLILIDEPELSLHPRWQIAYIDYLLAAIEPFQGCHVLIATHSPLIVQRGQSLDIGVVQIGQESPVAHQGLESVSVEGTLLDIFDTPVSGSVHLANQIFSAITDAEAGDETARKNSLADLARLKELYSDPLVGDPKALELIVEAEDLLYTSEEGNA